MGSHVAVADAVGKVEVFSAVENAALGNAPEYDLSAREAEVLELLAQGKTRTEIAEQLMLSSWTMKDYLTSIFRKVGVHSAKELMVLVAGGE